MDPTKFLKQSLRMITCVMFCVGSVAESLEGGTQTTEKEPSLRYVELLSYSSGQFLWFSNGRLNLSGLSLLGLLADLGIRADPRLVAKELNNQRKTDEQLTAQFVEIAMLFDGYQIKSVEDPVRDIVLAVKKDTLAEYVDQLVPQFVEVVRLRAAIAKFRAMLQIPWPRIPSGFSPRLGQAHSAIEKIRFILTSLGDLVPADITNKRRRIFDTEVTLALKRFQVRHGISSSGKLDEVTITALNRSPLDLLRVMQVNLWRWLSLPSVQPQRYVLVNIPSYDLSFIENGRETFSMKVIVGQQQFATPIMVTEIDRITINPTWTPTWNIVKSELEPEHFNNPSVLKSRGFQLLSGFGKQTLVKEIDATVESLMHFLPQYRLVQSAGKRNALGQYRFNIQTSDSVYLHDTPNRMLFSKTMRALSHGCIRLQDAEGLNNKILSLESFQLRKQLETALRSGNTRHLKLSATIPVYITYQTLQVSASGLLQWREDLYGLDKTQFGTTISNVVLARSGSTQ